MRTTCKVVMLESNQANSMKPKDYNNTLVKNYTTNKLELKTFEGWDNIVPSKDHIQSQHLYILSDAEIKEEDWVADLAFGKVYQSDKESIKVTLRDEFKIIASTDKSLGYEDNIRISKGRFNNTYPTFKALPLIPESFIKAYIKTYNEGKPITEVQVECYFTHETEGDKFLCYKTREDNTIIIHQNKTYKREEVITLLKEYRNSIITVREKEIKYLNKFIEENL